MVKRSTQCMYFKVALFLERMNASPIIFAMIIALFTFFPATEERASESLSETGIVTLPTQPVISQDLTQKKLELPKYFISRLSSLDESSMIHSFDPQIFTTREGSKPVSTMERIDSIQSIIDASATKYGVQSLTLEGIIYIELKGRQLATSSLAIDSLSRVVSRLTAKYPSPDLGITAYHIGTPSVDKMILTYRKNVGHASEKLTWTGIITGSSPFDSPAMHALVFHDVAGKSWSYYYRVRSAMDARALWRASPDLFRTIAKGFNCSFRETALAPEISWYKESRLPNLTDKDIAKLVKLGEFLPILTGDFMNIALRPDVSNPVLTPNSLGTLYSIASQMRQKTGQITIVSSAMRTRSYQSSIVKKGGSPVVYSTHLFGSGIDIALFDSKGLNDTFMWILDEFKWRGDLAWIRESNHFHVTIAPGTKYLGITQDALAYYQQKSGGAKKSLISKR